MNPVTGYLEHSDATRTRIMGIFPDGRVLRGSDQKVIHVNQRLVLTTWHSVPTGTVALDTQSSEERATWRKNITAVERDSFGTVVTALCDGTGDIIMGEWVPLGHRDMTDEEFQEIEDSFFGEGAEVPEAVAR